MSPSTVPVEKVTPNSRRSLLTSLIPMSQDILGRWLPDDDEIDHDKTD